MQCFFSGEKKLNFCVVLDSWLLKFEPISFTESKAKETSQTNTPASLATTAPTMSLAWFYSVKLLQQNSSNSSNNFTVKTISSWCHSVVLKLALHLNFKRLAHIQGLTTNYDILWTMIYHILINKGAKLGSIYSTNNWQNHWNWETVD